MHDVKRFTLERNAWYAWQMLPGYTGSPYLSPIRIHRVEPLGTGARRLRLHFYNAFYAEGVQDFVLTIQTLSRQREYLVGAVLHGDRCSDRTCIVHDVTFDWLETNARHMVENERPKHGERHGVDGVQHYLNRVLGEQDR